MEDFVIWKKEHRDNIAIVKEIARTSIHSDEFSKKIKEKGINLQLSRIFIWYENYYYYDPKHENDTIIEIDEEDEIDEINIIDIGYCNCMNAIWEGIAMAEMNLMWYEEEIRNYESNSKFD